MLIKKFPIILQRLTRILIFTAVLWVLYRYFFESLVLVERGWSIRVNTLPIQWAWCYMIIPVVFICLISGVIELILRELHGLLSGNTAMDLSDENFADDSPNTVDK